MADYTIHDLATATGRTSSVLWVQQPSATPSGYIDLKIDIDALLVPEQARLTTNETNIAENTIAIEALINAAVKSNFTNVASSFNTPIPGNSLIEYIFFKLVSGSPIVAVGTSLGAEDIVSSRAVTSFRSVQVMEYNSTLTPIYFTVTGGVVDISALSKLEIF